MVLEDGCRGPTQQPSGSPICSACRCVPPWIYCLHSQLHSNLMSDHRLPTPLCVRDLQTIISARKKHVFILRGLLQVPSCILQCTLHCKMHCTCKRYVCILHNTEQLSYKLSAITHSLPSQNQFVVNEGWIHCSVVLGQNPLSRATGIW